MYASSVEYRDVDVEALSSVQQVDWRTRSRKRFHHMSNALAIGMIEDRNRSVLSWASLLRVRESDRVRSRRGIKARRESEVL